jgi:hypothetical protein
VLRRCKEAHDQSQQAYAEYEKIFFAPIKELNLASMRVANEAAGGDAIEALTIGSISPTTLDTMADAFMRIGMNAVKRSQAEDDAEKLPPSTMTTIGDESSDNDVDLQEDDTETPMMTHQELLSPTSTSPALHSAAVATESEPSSVDAVRPSSLHLSAAPSSLSAHVSERRSRSVAPSPDESTKEESANEEEVDKVEEKEVRLNRRVRPAASAAPAAPAAPKKASVIAAPHQSADDVSRHRREEDVIEHARRASTCVPPPIHVPPTAPPSLPAKRARHERGERSAGSAAAATRSKRRTPHRGHYRDENILQHIDQGNPLRRYQSKVVPEPAVQLNAFGYAYFHATEQSRTAAKLVRNLYLDRVKVRTIPGRVHARALLGLEGKHFIAACDALIALAQYSATSAGQCLKHYKCVAITHLKSQRGAGGQAIHYDATNGPDSDSISFTFYLDERAVPSTYLPRFGVSAIPTLEGITRQQVELLRPTSFESIEVRAGEHVMMRSGTPHYGPKTRDQSRNIIYMHWRKMTPAEIDPTSAAAVEMSDTDAPAATAANADEEKEEEDAQLYVWQLIGMVYGEDSTQFFLALLEHMRFHPIARYTIDDQRDRIHAHMQKWLDRSSKRVAAAADADLMGDASDDESMDVYYTPVGDHSERHAAGGRSSHAEKTEFDDHPNESESDVPQQLDMKCDDATMLVTEAGIEEEHFHASRSSSSAHSQAAALHSQVYDEPMMTDMNVDTSAKPLACLIDATAAAAASIAAPSTISTPAEVSPPRAFPLFDRQISDRSAAKHRQTMTPASTRHRPGIDPASAAAAEMSDIEVSSLRTYDLFTRSARIAFADIDAAAGVPPVDMYQRASSMMDDSRIPAEVDESALIVQSGSSINFDCLFNSISLPFRTRPAELKKLIIGAATECLIPTPKPGDLPPLLNKKGKVIVPPMSVSQRDMIVSMVSAYTWTPLPTIEERKAQDKKIDEDIRKKCANFVSMRQSVIDLYTAHINSGLKFKGSHDLAILATIERFWHFRVYCLEWGEAHRRAAESPKKGEERKSVNRFLCIGARARTPTCSRARNRSTAQPSAELAIAINYVLLVRTDHNHYGLVGSAMCIEKGAFGTLSVFEKPSEESEDIFLARQQIALGEYTGDDQLAELQATSNDTFDLTAPETDSVT